VPVEKARFLTFFNRYCGKWLKRGAENCAAKAVNTGQSIFHGGLDNSYCSSEELKVGAVSQSAHRAFTPATHCLAEAAFLQAVPQQFFASAFEQPPSFEQHSALSLTLPAMQQLPSSLQHC
jgi:hypothetical protein